jgi:hypothetical protein
MEGFFVARSRLAVAQWLHLTAFDRATAMTGSCAVSRVLDATGRDSTSAESVNELPRREDVDAGLAGFDGEEVAVAAHQHLGARG